MLIQALQGAGIYEDTALFFFADHGDFTGDYGLVEKTQNTFEDYEINFVFRSVLFILTISIGYFHSLIAIINLTNFLKSETENIEQMIDRIGVVW